MELCFLTRLVKNDMNLILTAGSWRMSLDLQEAADIYSKQSHQLILCINSSFIHFLNTLLTKFQARLHSLSALTPKCSVSFQNTISEPSHSQKAAQPVAFRAAHWPGHCQTWLPCDSGIADWALFAKIVLTVTETCWALVAVFCAQAKHKATKNRCSWTGFKSKQLDPSPRSSRQSQCQTSKWIFYNKPKMVCDII